MRHFSIFLLAASCLLLAGPRAGAQRTMTGQDFVSVFAETPFTSAGLSAEWGRYHLYGLWSAGLSAVDRRVDFTSEGVTCRSSYLHTEAYYDWLFRIAATTSRSVSWYAGAGAFLGLETMDPFSRVPSDKVKAEEGTSFLYGLSVRTELEIFLSDALALVAKFRVPCNFNTRIPSGNVLFEAGLGLRFNL